MALSMSARLQDVRTVIASVTGMSRVYAQGATGDDALPMGLVELPAALVMAGATTQYLLGQGMHRHAWEARVLVLEASADYGEAATTVLPFVDRIIEAFAVNVTLGGDATYARFTGQSGLSDIEWAGATYLGHVITLEISEEATAAPAPGS